MSLSTFLGVETALRGLLAQQRALNITGHNIANANTVGYTRQTTTMHASAGVMEAPAGQIGTGVDVVEYARARDMFVDIQLRAQTMLQGYNDARSDGLKLLERFWSSWHDLGNAPENPATRQAVLQAGAALVGGLSSLRSQLGTIEGQ